MKKWLGNLRISRKLTFGFMFVTILGIIIGGVGVYSMTSMTKNQTATYNQCTVGIIVAENMLNSLTSTRMSIRDLYITNNVPADKTKSVNKINDGLKAIDGYMADCVETIKTQEDQANYDAAVKTLAAFKDATSTVLEAAKKDLSAGALLQLIMDGNDAAALASEAFEKISAYKVQLAAERLKSDTEASQAVTYILGGVTVVSVLLALVLSRMISNLLAPQVQKFAAFAKMLTIGDIDVSKIMTEKDKKWVLRKDEIGTLADSYLKVIDSTKLMAGQTQAIADGDLTTVVTVRSEFDVQGKALEELVNKFQALTQSIVTASEQVAAGASLVSNSSMSLSQGATTQASSVQQLSASVQEIAAKTATNATNAQMANNLTKEVKRDGETGNEQMKEMLGAMDEINQSSSNIGKIIKVIDDIAFQTNILALNAAVEAARAGQYGKGFAVVAEEVRNLAAKSANAAKETTNLIEGSVRTVEKGMRIANSTAGALHEIVNKVSSAADLIGAIALSSEEQAAAIEQINQGITEVSQIVQNTAATSEESAATSEELSSQALTLKEQTSYFKIRMRKAAGNTSETVKSLRKRDEKIGMPENNKVTIALGSGELGKY